MYSCFSEKGEEKLPSNERISELLQSEIQPVIFLDSCVCLHIIKVVDYGRKATNVDVKKILEFKQYLESHPEINIHPLFGLIELCSNGSTINNEKLNDFTDRIDFFKKIRFKQLRAMKYDFHANYFSLEPPINISDSLLDAIAPSFKNTYCALLKIRNLAKGNLSKKYAEQNTLEFFDWMSNELEIIRGPEYKLAMNIFGGNTDFRKMIGLDGKISDIKKKLLGTTWDIFHAKHASNSFVLTEMLGESVYPYFLTSDKNLFNIFRQLSLTLIKDGGRNLNTSFLMNSDIDVPHFDESFHEKQNRKLLNTFIDRRNQEYKFDVVKVDKMISDLEIENDIVNC